MPERCIEGDPIRMFPSDFRLRIRIRVQENDPKIYIHIKEKKYYLPFEMTICSREGFSWFNSDEYEKKEFTDISQTVQNCIRAFLKKIM